MRGRGGPGYPNLITGSHMGADEADVNVAGDSV